jgi:hypothetical protein
MEKQDINLVDLAQHFGDEDKAREFLESNDGQKARYARIADLLEKPIA